MGTTNRLLNQALKEGADARLEQEDVTTSPYSSLLFPKLHKAWVDGWNQMNILLIENKEEIIEEPMPKYHV